MPDDGFQERLRALADQLSRSISDADLDNVADRLGVDPDRVRGAAGAVEGWLAGQASAQTPLFGETAAAPDPERPLGRRPPSTGPHPLDLPTDEQGRALSALGSSRWSVRPGSSRLVASGAGPEPPDDDGGPSDLVNELRARDWITADGEVTLVGRQALLRWCQTAATPTTEDADPPA